MSQETYNSLMDQQENNEVYDPTGLFVLLKNIQNQACSNDYLCIEIGTIYGDFSKLRPKQIVVPTNEREDIQLVIKPVVVVNNTVVKPPKMKRPPIKKPPTEPPKNITQPKIFDDGDCEGDFFNSLADHMRFSVRIKKILYILCINLLLTHYFRKDTPKKI